MAENGRDITEELSVIFQELMFNGMKECDQSSIYFLGPWATSIELKDAQGCRLACALDTE